MGAISGLKPKQKDDTAETRISLLLRITYRKFIFRKPNKLKEILTLCLSNQVKHIARQDKLSLNLSIDVHCTDFG